MSKQTSVHPDTEFEARVMRRALRGIVSELESLRAREYLGADRWVEKKLRQLRADRIEVLEDMTDEPYFGRLDVDLHDDGGQQTLYISKHDATVQGVRIIDWRTPVGGIFYNGGGRDHDYSRPDGKKGAATLWLKRQLLIRDGNLRRIVDLADYREGAKSTTSEDDFLAQQLAERGEFRLQDIVRTIQEDQNELIRRPNEGALVIQGVAGSGKTTVAYYRLAFLLYPDNNTGVTAPTTLILGPSPLFLSYTAELLPDLGERHVRQNTFENLALAQVYSERGSIRRRKARFRRLRGLHQLTVLDPTLQLMSASRVSAERKTAAMAAARLRGSLNMRALMKALADETTEQLLAPLIEDEFEVPHFASAFEVVSSRQTQEFEGATQEFMLKALNRLLAPDRVSRALNTLGSEPIGLARMAGYRRLLEHAGGGPRQRGLDPVTDLLNKFGFTGEHERARLTQRVEAVVEEYLDQLIPPTDALTLYYDLLEDPRRLAQLCERIGLGASEATTLAGRRRPGRDTVYADDIPAILALHFELFGTWITDWRAYSGLPENTPPPDPPRHVLSHLVIDEAQDVSPLAFHLLKGLGQNLSMTVLGDMSQGIFDYRGSVSWDEIIDTLGRDQCHFEEMLRSYRSTYEIVEFCNELLRDSQGYTASLAAPVPRHGRKPRVVVSDGPDNMRTTVESSIHELLDAGYSTIAVICRNDHQRGQTYGWLRERFEHVHELSSDASTFGGGLSVVTAADSKGLEFEAVLVVDVSVRNYADGSQFDRKSLYVACTRALHVLELHAPDAPSTLLTHALEKADLTGTGQTAEGNDALDPFRRQEAEVSDQERDDREVMDFIRSGLAEAQTWRTATDVDHATSARPCRNWRAIVAFVAEVGDFAERPKAVKYINRIDQHQQSKVLSYLGRRSTHPGVQDEAKRIYRENHVKNMSDPTKETGWWH